MPRRLSRPGAVLAAVALSLGLAVVPALAANTRTVFFGSPGTTASDPGLIVTTDVTAGGATAFDLELQNLSSSELTHVLIQGGGAAPNPLANLSYPAPPPICTTDSTTGTTTCIPSLPPGTSYVAAYVSPASTVPVSCSVSSTSLSCSVGNMAPNDVALVRVVLQPPATAGTNVQFWLASSLKEGTSSTGSNQDTFFAYGSFNVLTPSCREVANFFPAGQQVNVSNTTAGTCNQATNVSSNASFSQGAYGQAGAVTSPLYCVPGITTCFGEMSQANVNFGSNPSGTYVQWDIVWTGADLPTSGKASGVTHFLDGYDPATNPNAFVNITFKPRYQCSASLTVNCWVSTAATKTSFEAIIRTGNNGYVRGY